LSYKIADIQGIGSVFKRKLGVEGIKTTGDLLRSCSKASGRRQVGQKTGLSEGQLLKWANMADMMRVSGIGPQYAELLEASGVDTVKELKLRNAENLAKKMAEVNAKKKLSGNSPAASVIEKWIAQAKSTTPTISH
jgi:predicted flap endonuclease-1-like 5' DNA nuclease